MQRKFSLEEVSESVWKWPLPRFAPRCNEVIASGAIKCCVSEGGKSKVGFVRIAVIERSKMLRTCSNVRFGEVAPQHLELA